MSLTHDCRPRQTSQQHHNGKRRRQPRETAPAVGPPMEWDNGTVKFYTEDGERKFGYITPDSGGNDVYVDGRLLARWGLKSLDATQRVRFKFVPGRKSGHYDAHSIRPI